jgi:hypothetical protein
MKLNVWQMIGAVLLVIGIALWVYKKTRPDPQPAPNPSPPAATQPAATQPAA